VIDFVRKSNGLQYSEEVMLRYRTDAFEILHQFPPSDVRDGLEELVIFVTDRKK
jgi:octaprenyl-diphosphate synthase